MPLLALNLALCFIKSFTRDYRKWCGPALSWEWRVSFCVALHLSPCPGITSVTGVCWRIFQLLLVNVKSPVKITCMFFGLSRLPYPNRTRTWKERANATQKCFNRALNMEPSCCEVTVPTTKLLCTTVPIITEYIKFGIFTSTNHEL